jgi:hypothetical protein
MTDPTVNASIGTDISYILAVTGGHVATNCYDIDFTVEKVEWQTYVYEGKAYRTVRAYGANTNCTWHLNYEKAPEWVPRPPKTWFQLADEIAAQAVTS